MKAGRPKSICANMVMRLFEGSSFRGRTMTLPILATARKVLGGGGSSHGSLCTIPVWLPGSGWSLTQIQRQIISRWFMSGILATCLTMNPSFSKPSPPRTSQVVTSSSHLVFVNGSMKIRMSSSGGTFAVAKQRVRLIGELGSRFLKVWIQPLSAMSVQPSASPPSSRMRVSSSFSLMSARAPMSSPSDLVWSSSPPLPAASRARAFFC
mmetsp:Transcript_883/g.2335  ORF Transcript_883/g.2335 Transcript_883/m.2335 type:complete len:209 (+) Transcript_883:200-826(+)